MAKITGGSVTILGVWRFSPLSLMISSMGLSIFNLLCFLLAEQSVRAELFPWMNPSNPSGCLLKWPADTYLYRDCPKYKLWFESTMSSQGSPGVEFSTTTVSSVAVQAGDSKIVIAIIKVSQQLSFFSVLVGFLLFVDHPREHSTQSAVYRI